MALEWFPGCPVWEPKHENDLGVPPAPPPDPRQGRVVRDWVQSMLCHGWTPRVIKQKLQEAGWSESRKHFLLKEADEALDGTGL